MVALDPHPRRREQIATEEWVLSLNTRAGRVCGLPTVRDSRGASIEGSKDIGDLINRGRKTLDTVASIVMIESKGITENVPEWTTGAAGSGWQDQAAVVGGDDEPGSVSGGEFGEQVPDVGLDGLDHFLAVRTPGFRRGEEVNVLVTNGSLVSFSLLLSGLTPAARFLPDLAGTSLYLGSATDAFGSPELLIDPLPDGLVMAAWTIGLLVAAALVWERRDA